MADDFANCPPEVCASLPASLAKQCKDSGFGPDHPVAVVLGKTDICQCKCGDAVGAERDTYQIDADANGAGVPDCPWMECEFAPITVEACQGLPPGTPVVLHSGSTDKCRCSCWGGQLAPYKVLNGEGDFVALDELPAGGFISAAGSDLRWMNVPVRYATRPRQATPQSAIRLKTAEAEMVVPRTHIFVTLQHRLIPAYRLNTKLVLLAPDGKGIPIVEIEEYETKSTFQFVATSEETPLEDLRYHLLNSQGVVSGDYAVQRAYEERELPAERLAYPYPPQSSDEERAVASFSLRIVSAEDAPVSVEKCPSDLCSNPAIREKINEACKANQWPVGHHVIIASGDHFCYCECGGGIT